MPSLSQFVPVSLAAITLVLILWFFIYTWRSRRICSGADPLAWVRQTQDRCGPSFSLAGKLHPMERKDTLPLLLITGIYALTAFAHLGSRTAPQEMWNFAGGTAVTIEISGDPVTAHSLRYYSGLGTGAYQVEISPDGEEWLSLWARRDDPDHTDKVTGWYWADSTGYAPSRAMTQDYTQLFKWSDLPLDNPQPIRFLRLTGRGDKDLLQLGRVCLLDAEGQPIPLNWGMADGSPVPEGMTSLFLVDEAVPTDLSWYNSTYFDEIYHARTAQEHIEGIYPYEISHPPLGKLILGLGIRAFGMTPFGWRFMGTLFGVGMLPLLYLFLKNMFGKTVVAACGTTLFAADFMHLTQTRIATIDTYGVFFILLMYYFMYRYLALPEGSSFGKCALPLFLSGLFWGIGAASKWTVIYGCVGLVVLYFLGLWQKLRHWPAERRQERTTWAIQILLFSVVCFALIPAAIYTLSYLPYAQAKGDIRLSSLVRTMWDNQVYMLTYHQGVSEPHPYSSRWWQWILDIRPILYYLDTSVPGMKTAFGAFSNPVVCWGGLLAMVLVAVQAVRRRCGQALFLLIGYLSQLVPWLFIGRTTFEYHYFPSILFLAMALAYVFDELARRQPPGWRSAVYGLTGGAVGLYALFYPVLAGVAIPTWYSSTLLRWLPSWPF